MGNGLAKKIGPSTKKRGHCWQHGAITLLPHDNENGLIIIGYSIRFKKYVYNILQFFNYKTNHTKHLKKKDKKNLLTK